MDILEQLQKAGAQKAYTDLTTSAKYEMNVESGELTLIRSTDDISLHLCAMKNGQKGTTLLNRTEESAIAAAIQETLELVAAAQPDPANDIAPYAPAESFSAGPCQPDREAMYSRLQEFLRQAHTEFPKVSLDSLYFSFIRQNSHYQNTNGVDFTDSRGFYSLSLMAMGVDGEHAGSFNGTGFTTFDLNRPLMEYASVRELLRMCSEQIHTKQIGAQFEGDVIFSPDCAGDIVQAYCDTFLSDHALISGTSILKQQLDEPVASPLLTLRSTPTDPLLSGGFHVYNGFKAEDEIILEQGVLRNFALSQYGANKTGLQRSKSGCEILCMDAGTTPYAEMLRSVKRGLLVCRFSGGNPTPSGDLSGVAKNSYYIENGQIQYPVNETMIAGNLYQFFKQIGAISKERTNFGTAILPSILIQGVQITG